MDYPKYDGNIHPDKWIDDILKYFEFKQIPNIDNYHLKSAISMVDSTISLPTGIDSFEKLRNVLKKDISFTIFKNTNKRILQSFKYIPERKGGNTSKFVLAFRKLCYNAEIDIEEQKRCLYKSLLTYNFDYISNEFYEEMKGVDSINELIENFEDLVSEESNLIANKSIVALRHVATGKYLSSIENQCYVTGSRSQLVFAGNPYLDQNSLWKINFNKSLATYTDAFITLQHVKSKMFLGINYGKRNVTFYSGVTHNESPSTNHTEVSCNNNIGGNYCFNSWKVNCSKFENPRGFLKSDDIINLSIRKCYDNNGVSCRNDQYEFLRSQDIQFTIGNDSFQEVVCHNERLGGNDDWCIELIGQEIR